MGADVRVVALGTFDCLHYGHVRLFQRAACLGSLTVGVNSDRFVRHYKGVDPVSNHHRRAATVAALSCVDDVLINDGPGRDLIEQTLPRFLVVGSDWHGRDYLAQIDIDQDRLDWLGVSVVYMPRTPDVSSSEIRDRLP